MYSILKTVKHKFYQDFQLFSALIKKNKNSYNSFFIILDKLKKEYIRS